MIDKSIRADYAIQGGGPNYLGKQKMVKAPKKWQSSPDHDPAELAYITKKEKDILIALDVHGSLKDGKPNRGPSGIISLQGDMGSVGGGGSSGGGGGGRDRWDWSPAPAPAPAPSPHRDDSAERAAQAAADALNAAREAEARESAREKAIQVAALTPKTIEPIRSAHVDTPTQIAEQKEIDLYGYQDAKAKAPTTLKPKTITYDRGIPHLEDKLIPTTVGQTLFDPRTSQNVLLDRGTGIGSVAKRIFGESPLEIALNIGTMGGSKLAKLGKTAYDVKQRKGIYGSALGWGEKLTGRKLNLSNLTSNIEKARGRRFDPKDPIGWTGEQKRNKTFHEGRGDGETTIAQQVSGGENVIAKAINQFAGTEVEGQISSLVQNNLNQALRYYSDMHSRIEKGYSPNRQEMDVFKLLEHYLNQEASKQKSAAYGGRIDKPLMGRSRDI